MRYYIEAMDGSYIIECNNREKLSFILDCLEGNIHEYDLVIEKLKTDIPGYSLYSNFTKIATFTSLTHALTVAVTLKKYKLVYYDPIIESLLKANGRRYSPKIIQTKGGDN